MTSQDDCGYTRNDYQAAPGTLLLSTHCVFCGKALRDAESVERGCGPDCASKYGALSASSAAEWERFGELLRTAPESVQLAVSRGDTRDAHDIMNRLIHVAGAHWSANTDDARMVIASVAELSEALGYEGVGAKLKRRYITGESGGPKIYGFRIYERDERGAKIWCFKWPTRIGNRQSWWNQTRSFESAGGRTERGSWINCFPYTGESSWLRVLNTFVELWAGTPGVLPDGETFVVPAEELDVPADEGSSAGAPDAQTGQDGFDEPPPVSAEQLKKGMRVQMRDGSIMYVRWIGQRSGEWRVGLSQTEQQRGGYVFVGLREIATTKPTSDEQQGVEDATDEELPSSVSKRELPAEMFEHQREGAMWLDAKGSGLLAFEPGLGKTITSLSVADAPVLVVVPAKIRVNWLREVNRWRPDLSCAILGLRARKRGSGWVKHAPSTIEARRKYVEEVLAADVVITNYEALLNSVYSDMLSGRNWQTLIVDECHRIKELRVSAKKLGSQWVRKPSPKPKAAHALWYIRQKAKRVFLLTGTPMVNGRNYELFPQLHFVAPEDSPFRTFREYCKQFCPPRYQSIGGGRSVQVYDTNTNKLELHELIDGHYQLRKKKDVIDLPEKQRRSIYVQLDEAAAIDYQEAAQAFLEWVQRHGGAEALTRAQRAEAIVKLTTLRRLSAIGKAPAVAEEMVTHVLGTGRPLVVMAHHAEAAHALAGYLDAINEGAAKPGGIRIDREIRYGFCGWGEQSQSVIDEFQIGLPEEAPPEERSYLDVIICSILAAGVGLNLYRASDMFFVERDWRPMFCVQAEDRIHRIGQENKCIITYFEGSGTIDGYIAQLLVDKTATSAKVIDGEDLDETSAVDRVMGAMFGGALEMASNPFEHSDEESDSELDWLQPD